MFSGTVRENLQLIHPGATEEQLCEALRIACAEDFIRALPLGLDTPVREQGGGFSEGQLQRLCIASALLSDAPILLLDEATSALDVKTERTLLENIQSFRKGRTCIITTHRPSVLSICQRAYLIQDQAVSPVEQEQVGQMLEEF